MSMQHRTAQGRPGLQRKPAPTPAAPSHPSETVLHLERSLTEWLSRLSGGERLPALRDLAQTLETNKDTLATALHRLEASGHVVRRGLRRGWFRPGLGITASSQDGISGLPSAPDRPPPPPPPIAEPPHETILSHLRREILEGQYQPGDRLPSAKALQARYGHSPLAVRRALRTLAEARLAHRAGKGYAVAGAAVPQGKAAARVHFAASWSLAKPIRPGTQEFLVPLELELRRNGWGDLRYVWSDVPNEKDCPPPDRISAFVGVRSVASELWSQFFDDRFRIPLVAYDPSETLEWGPAAFPKHSAASLFPIVPDNHQSGLEMVAHLRRSGFRRIAFFSHVSEPQTPRELRQRQWLRRRLLGLREAAADMRDGWREYFLPSEAGASVDAGASANAGASAIPRPPPQAAAEVDELRRLMHKASVRQTHLSKELWRMQSHALELLESMMKTAERMQPLFEKVLAEGWADCWVCVNDELAAGALQFLESHSVRVAQDIALAGFDNSRIAYALGITSYDFLLGKAGTLAARCLCYPRLARRDREGFIRLSGQVIVRASTGGGN